MTQTVNQIANKIYYATYTDCVRREPIVNQFHRAMMKVAQMTNNNGNAAMKVQQDCIAMLANQKAALIAHIQAMENACVHVYRKPDGTLIRYDPPTEVVPIIELTVDEAAQLDTLDLKPVVISEPSEVVSEPAKPTTSADSEPNNDVK